MRVRVGFAFSFYATLSIFGAGVLLRAQTPAPAAPAAAATQDSTNDLSVSVGKSVLVDTAHPVERVAVASSDLAEATAVSPTEIMLNGKAPGETTLIVWQTGGVRQFFNVTVHASNYAVNDHLDTVRRELRTEFPGQTLRVSAENGLVFLRGTVKDLDAAARAAQIAATTGSKVVNLLYVDVPPAEPQILLKVRFASYDRTLARQLGINLFSLGATNSIGSVTTQQFSPPSITGIPGTASSPTSATVSNLLNLFIFRPDLNLGATIEALQTEQVVQVLAEPNLLTANGKEGSFLAGGQYPFPVVQGATGTGVGAVTIQFKEFGIRLNFIPTITPRGSIRLQVAPEVSSLDFANGVTISGFTVPGLDVRRVKTEVELGQGQSFAIGGLLDNRSTRNFSKIPFLGDIPILGKFFQSVNVSKTDTELIVIVTPEIVQPIPVGAPLPQVKTTDKFLSSDSTVLTNAQNAESAGAKPATPPPATMPVEKLVDSMKPEEPLVIEGGMSASGGSTSSTTSSTTSTAPTQ